MKTITPCYLIINNHHIIGVSCYLNSHCPNLFGPWVWTGRNVCSWCLTYTCWKLWLSGWNSWHGPCDSAGAAWTVSVILARYWSNQLWNKWCSCIPKAAAGGCTASGRHMFILVSVVLMGYVKPSTLPCPAHLGTDSHRFLKRQLELEAMPRTSC